MTTPDRPLSPHLQVYRWQITMALSILHRMTGVALTFGLFVIAWWLLAAASGPVAYAKFLKVAMSPLGMVALIGWSFAMFYHFCSGMRHLVMDAGFMFKIPEIYKGGYAVLGATVLFTGIFWLSILL